MEKGNRELGQIVVYAVMDDIKGEALKGVKINLYRINGISPSLEESLITDEYGKVEFNDITEGNYRVIEIIDKSKFKKPTYYKWNEVNISKYEKNTIIYIINRSRN